MISYMSGAYVPNDQLSIPVVDLGFMRSQTAYQCVRYYNGHLFDFETHFERFVHTIRCQALPPLTENVLAICHSLIEKNGLSDGIFRLYRTPGLNGEPRLIVLSEPLPIYEKSTSAVVTTPNFRTHPDLKATHYAPAIVALERAKQNGFDDVLFFNERGELLELAYSNFFAIKGSDLLTPKTGILPGVTRKHILKLASSIGLTPIECTLNIRQLPQFDEVFHTNTTREVIPITQIDEILYPVCIKTLQLHQAFKKSIESLLSIF